MKSQPTAELASGITENAVSVYAQDNALDDFPVLKAFQQYIDAEQSKARRRLLVICASFSFIIVVIVTVFVILLVNLSSRNQLLNDRLVEYAMNDRERSRAPIVVQPTQDSSAALSTLNSKIDELKKCYQDSQKKDTNAVVTAPVPQKETVAAKPPKPQGPSPEELEIKRLKALLDAEREKHSVEKKRQREEELEAYRRKHYPELYGEDGELKRPRESSAEDPVKRDKKAKPSKQVVPKRTYKVLDDKETDDLLNEVDAILEASEAISYFDEKDDSNGSAPLPEQNAAKQDVKQPKENSIPVEIKGSSSSWLIPSD